MTDVVVDRSGEAVHWTARTPAGAELGSLTVLDRPDRRRMLLFSDCADTARAALLAAVTGELPGELVIECDEAADVQTYVAAGFEMSRRDTVYEVPTDPARTGLADVALPDGFALLQANQLEEARLRTLDDRMRQDVPGADGWQWDVAGFRAETYESPAFDPTTYLIAVAADGTDAGLIRVWHNPNGWRLGLIATARGYRRKGLARGLIARVWGDLHRRGASVVSTEVDTTNTASNALLTRIGARRIGGTVELSYGRFPVSTLKQ